jgi:hypothetical protein
MLKDGNYFVISVSDVAACRACVYTHARHAGSNNVCSMMMIEGSKRVGAFKSFNSFLD